MIRDFSEGPGQSPALRQVRAAWGARVGRGGTGTACSWGSGFPNPCSWGCTSVVVLGPGPSLLQGRWVQAGSYAWRDKEIKICLSWLSSDVRRHRPARIRGVQMPYGPVFDKVVG